MKASSKKLKKILSMLLSAALLFGCTSCGGSAGGSAKETSASSGGTASSESAAATTKDSAGSKGSDAENSAETKVTGASDTSENEESEKKASALKDAAAQSDGGGKVVKRAVRSSISSMGEADTWTILVYLCGSDLESEAGMATWDLLEMIEGNAGEQIRFVVQTGGSSRWEGDGEVISADEIQRYVVENGDAFLIDSKPLASMADSGTLADFLAFGVENYPADKMGLILWDHGSGSINGVCFDENDQMRSLRLKDVDAALFSVYDSMTQPFEFIGFDACLMSSLETAALLATHAKYMYASEELEPGYGWDYTAIGEFLNKNPGADGYELGEVVCDSFYDACADIGQENSATLSVLDLSKIDNLITAFDDYAQDIYTLTEDGGDDFAYIARRIPTVDNYGGNNPTEGYANMVDLKGVIETGANLSDNADAALSALDDVVLYQIHGSDHTRAGGISVYYPLKIQGSQELGIFADVCTSAYYLGLVDKIAYGYGHAGDISAYSNEEAVNSYSTSFTGEDYSEEGGYTATGGDDWDYVDSVSDGGSTAITFAEAPNLNEDGIFSFTLDENGLQNTSSVQAVVIMPSPDGEDLISLGLTSDVEGDWETGTFADNFDGYWFALPDEQLLNIYLVEECDGYDIFTTPILRNGKETNLRFKWDYNSGDVTIIDIWDGIDAESGAAGRSPETLVKGDVITPMYDAFTLEDMEELDYSGSEYVYDGDNSLVFTLLPDGDYWYGFSIDDIYGNYLTTDVVKFSVQDGEPFFNED